MNDDAHDKHQHHIDHHHFRHLFRPHRRRCAHDDNGLWMVGNDDDDDYDNYDNDDDDDSDGDDSV